MFANPPEHLNVESEAALIEDLLAVPMKHEQALLHRLLHNPQSLLPCARVLRAAFLPTEE